MLLESRRSDFAAGSLFFFAIGIVSIAAMSALTGCMQNSSTTASTSSTTATEKNPAPPVILPESWKLGQAYTVGGDGGWDIITLGERGNLLYVPRSTHTMVVDLAAGVVVGDIPDNSRAHGVAIAPGTGRGFISNGSDGTVQIFDVNNYKTLGRIKAADDADCILYDPASNRILCFCGDAGVMVPIDPKVDPTNGHADTPLNLQGSPEFAVVDGEGKAFVNLENKDQVEVIDTKAMKIITKWSIGDKAKTPVGIAYDPEHKHLFISCRSQDMVVMDAKDGKILADLPIGAGTDGAGFCMGTAFASCGRDGTVTAVRETSPGKFEVIQTLQTAVRARTMTTDPKTGYLYLPVADGQGRSVEPGSFRILVAKPVFSKPKQSAATKPNN